MLSNVIIVVLLAVVVLVYVIERNVKSLVRHLEQRRADLQERAWNAGRDYRFFVDYAHRIETELEATPNDTDKAIAHRVRQKLAGEEAEDWQLELIVPEVVARARSYARSIDERAHGDDDRLARRVSDGLDGFADRARLQPEWLQVYGATAAAREVGFWAPSDDERSLTTRS